MKTFAIAKALVINDQGELLLLRRSKTDTRRPGQWDLPGGMVEDGEDAWAAVIRETQEEVGLSIEHPSLFYATTEYNEEHGSGTWLAFAVEVKGQPKVTLSFEHDDHTWMKLDEALTAVTYHRQHNMISYLLDHLLLS